MQGWIILCQWPVEGDARWDENREVAAEFVGEGDGSVVEGLAAETAPVPRGFQIGTVCVYIYICILYTV